jgi:hypothetical protein
MLTVQRSEGDPLVYTPGTLTGDDGTLLCVTLEPGLNRPQHPAIPSGTYNLTVQKFGEVYTWMKKDLASRASTMEQRAIASSFAQNGVPLLMYVAGRGGIEIHIGNTEKDTLGCTLLGDQDMDNGSIISSTAAYFRVYPIILGYIQSNENPQIEYIDA